MGSFVAQSRKILVLYNYVPCRSCTHFGKHYAFFPTPFINAAKKDFSTLVKILEFDLNERLIDVNITILNDELMESNESFVIIISYKWQWSKVVSPCTD